MLGSTKGKKHDIYVLDYVVYDLETTGTSFNNDMIVEISAVRVKNHEVVAEYSRLVNPERSIPDYVVSVHGITDDMVKGEPAIREILPEFLDFIGDDVLVGHNIHNFDNRFLYRFCKQYFGKVPDNDYVDTLSLARGIFPDMKHHRLADMIAYYGVELLTAHRALDDSKMNQQVYEHLGKDLGRRGIDKSRLKICPRCGEPMRKRKGKYGEFWGCEGYPDCRYTEDV